MLFTSLMAGCLQSCNSKWRLQTLHFRFIATAQALSVRNVHVFTFDIIFIIIELIKWFAGTTLERIFCFFIALRRKPMPPKIAHNAISYSSRIFDLTHCYLLWICAVHSRAINNAFVYYIPRCDCEGQMCSNMRCDDAILLVNKCLSIV